MKGLRRYMGHILHMNMERRMNMENREFVEYMDMESGKTKCIKYTTVGNENKENQ